MTVRVANVMLPVETDFSDKAQFVKVCAKNLRVPIDEIINVTLRKKSVDARKNRPVSYVCSFDVEIKRKLKAINPVSEKKYEPHFPEMPSDFQPIVVGTGPAGLFAALIFAECGACPIVIERGKDVDSRINDVNSFWCGNQLHTNSNVQFGEGGAGTFSDGKLNTGIKDIRCRYVLEKFYEYGANESILYDAKPHIGTDKLSEIVKNIRNRIVSLGGKVLFEHRLCSLDIKNGILQGITVESAHGKTEIPCRHLVVAIGHSARDTFEMLQSAGVFMCQKPFSVGVRIEHPQEMINNEQYGPNARHDILGAADYKLSTHLKNGRGVYTFCMCPGGYVVAASSEKNLICTNGMSNSKRDGQNANSALLVSVLPEDFSSSDPLAGVQFQKEIEQKAFDINNDGYKAPVQLVGDFLSDRISCDFGSVEPTYKPGTKFCSISDFLPDFVSSSLKLGIQAFGQKIKGFDRDDAILCGPETRSSSPVRILRDTTTFESNISGLFPSGEGSGYAGGIMSAAVDGIRTAEAVINKIINGD